MSNDQKKRKLIKQGDGSWIIMSTTDRRLDFGKYIISENGFEHSAHSHFDIQSDPVVFLECNNECKIDNAILEIARDNNVYNANKIILGLFGMEYAEITYVILEEHPSEVLKEISITKDHK